VCLTVLCVSFCFIVMYVVSLFSMLSYCLVGWYYLSCLFFVLYGCFLFFLFLVIVLYVCVIVFSSSYLVFVFFVLVYRTLSPGRNPIAVNNNNNNNNNKINQSVRYHVMSQLVNGAQI
jgi:hypothetical protein